ncbi:MAG: GIY-YIG nuclease family protein [Planctomycetes bacterium]|nr:GIY-YIG nuclease family protein [Planctomycetota bacterium]
MATWYVYMLRTKVGALYTGIATDVARRQAEHETGKRGAKALRGKGPLQLVLKRRIGEKPLALRVELAIKGLSKLEKEALAKSKRRMADLVRSVKTGR